MELIQKPNTSNRTIAIEKIGDSTTPSKNEETMVQKNTHSSSEFSMLSRQMSGIGIHERSVEVETQDFNNTLGGNAEYKLVPTLNEADNQLDKKSEKKGVVNDQQCNVKKGMPSNSECSKVALSAQSQECKLHDQKIKYDDTMDSSGEFSIKKRRLDHLDTSQNKKTSMEIKKETNTYFFVDPLLKHQVIDQIRNESEPLTTVCIRSPKDLQKHGLMPQTWLKDGKLKNAEGRLFEEKPLTLIFDLTEMTSADIASFNDVLQENPSCNGKPLGSQVKRVCLVNDAMIKGDQPSNPDLWRRLGEMTQKVITDTDKSKDVITDAAWLSDISKDTISEDKQVVTIDFTLSDDWSQKLFGVISIDEKGKFVFVDGALAKLPDNAHLVFKNAPWESPGFKEELTTVLRQGVFEANHEPIKLPRNITISKKDITKEELNSLKNAEIRDNRFFNSKGTVVCLNASSIENLQGDKRVEGSRVVLTNLMAELLKGSSQLAITSPLDDNQWLWLLTQLKQLPKHIQPAVFYDLPPTLLVTENKDNCCVVSDPEEFIRCLGSESYSKYTVSANDGLECFNHVNMTSQKDFTFSLGDSQLLKLLKQGELVLLSGLDKNPTLASNLETLLLQEPYLFVNGYKIELPNVKIVLVKSKDAQKLDSPLMKQVFSECSDKVPTAGNPVYTLLQQLPQIFNKKYPVTPPWGQDVFEQLFNEQALMESKLDGSDKLLPCHKRRAMHVLLAKAYRGDANVYGFIKAKVAEYYPDEPSSSKADRGVLNQWLLQHPEPDLAKIQSDFWTLAQHCPVDTHESVNKIDKVYDESAKQIASYILCTESNIARQRKLAKQLGIDVNTVKKRLFYDAILRSTLRDVLVANKAFIKPDVVISEVVTSLGRDIEQVLKGTEADSLKTQEIRRLVEYYFKNEKLPEHYEDVPESILTNQRHSLAQQERRLVHLAHRVEKHPIVFLQGESGAGKTFMAQAVATKAGYPGCQVIQLSPHHTAEDLFGGLKLIKQTKGGVTDEITKFIEGPLLKWAQLDDPPLLILDEANLAREGLLAPLAGLTQDPPVIYYRGREYKLSKKHRIILTGNPDHYQGRHLDETLKSCVPTFFYHPLPESVIANSIIKPGLPTQWSDGMKQQACDRSLALFNNFQKLVPGDLTTPRDLKDVLATVRQILSHHTSTDRLSEKQINALIRRAFMDSLAGAVKPEQQTRLNSLNVWYEQQFPEDDTVVTGVDTAFQKFIAQLKDKKSKANFNPLPIEKLAYHYWQSLDKDNTGRIAAVVEGPAGCGKDFILKKVIDQWQENQSKQKWPAPPFVHINANANQWSDLVDKVEKAMKKGQVMAISELNLIPSHYLEGLFNEILTGDAKPGFRLFATINPGSFEGRESMSPALKSRCTQIKLRGLSQQEMAELLETTPDMPKELPQWLTSWFYQLSQALESQSSPVQLALDNLFKVATHLRSQDRNNWSEEFEKILSLPFKSLRGPLLSAQEYNKKLEQLKTEDEHRLACERIANSMSGLEAPITLQFGNNASFRNGVVTVSYKIKTRELLDKCRPLLEKQITKNRKKIIGGDDSKKKQSSAKAWDKQSKLTTKKSTEYTFGDIEVKKYYKVQCYFPKEPYADTYYRLKMLETKLDEDGQFRDYPISSDHDEVVPVSEWSSNEPWRTDIKKDEIFGKITLTLDNKWQALPALTPMDKLRTIKVDPKIEFDMMRNKATGQLLMKAKEQIHKPVTIDFIIAPEQDYFFLLENGDSVDTQDELCTRQLQEFLNKNIFESDDQSCAAFEELRFFNSIDDIPERLFRLMHWLKRFSTKKNLEGQGQELVLNMLREKVGVCRHRNMIFQTLCHYWGIPARQIENTTHGFAEVSPDGGKTWRQYQLGGGANNMTEIYEPDWGECKLPTDSTLGVARTKYSDQGGPEREYNSYGGQSTMPAEENIHCQVIYQLLKRQDEVSRALLRQLKEEWSGLLKKGQNIRNMICDFDGNWCVVLTEKFYKYVDQDEELKEVITKLLDLGTGDFFMAFSNKGFYDVCNDIQNNNSNRNLKPELYKSYVEWIFDLSDQNDSFKRKILPYFQEYAKTTDNITHIQRIKSMCTSVPEVDISYSGIYDRGGKFNSRANDLLSTFALSLPRSQTLDNITSQVKMVQEFYPIPKGNYQLVLEKLAAGLPAFLTKSTLKKSKPVIFYFRKREQEIDDLLINLNTALVVKKNYKELKQKLEAAGFFDNNEHMFQQLFFAWLARHKSEEGQVWRWLEMDEKKTYCTIQTTSTRWPQFIAWPESKFKSPDIVYPSDVLKKCLGEPEAIVLKDKDLLILLREFYSLVYI